MSCVRVVLLPLLVALLLVGLQVPLLLVLLLSVEVILLVPTMQLQEEVCYSPELFLIIILT